jgi:hypothetical protein
MAGLIDTTVLPNLTPVAAEAGAAEGEPRPVYTWEGPLDSTPAIVRSYTPSGGGAPRLVAVLGVGSALAVWDTGTGAFLGALRAPGGTNGCRSLVTYQRPSDDGPRVAAAFGRGRFGVWDGEDFRLLHLVVADPEGRPVRCLAVYEDPTGGSTRIVSG